MRFDDQGPYNPTAAHIARLDGSSPFPQVVVTHFTGGAHCCTDMTVLTFVDGRWQTVDVGEFDSDGPRIEDLNGDGAAELVGKDDSIRLRLRFLCGVLCAAKGAPAGGRQDRGRFAQP